MIVNKRKHAYLHEFEFRHNMRKTNGVGRITARLQQNVVTAGRLTYANIVQTVPYALLETA